MPRHAPKHSEPKHTGSGRSAPVRWVEDPVTGTPLTDELDAGQPDEAEEIDVEVGPGEVRCEQCNSVVGSDDIFCGECGFVSRSVTRAFRSSDFTGETRQIDLSPRSEAPSEPAQETEPSPKPQPAPESPLQAEPESPLQAEPELSTQPADDPTVDLEAHSEPAPEPSAPAAGPPRTPMPRIGPRQHDLVIPPAPVRRAAPPTPPAPPAATAPESVQRTKRSFLDDDDEADDAADLEATRIVNRISGNRFVLQFSTGESFTVHGAGLIGRNPQPEPGEFFDHLVRVLDSGKSVSKTHLEFGQEGGAFWLKDRFSGNGTVIREPDISARRAEPDRRYRVVRGTRIDIGEQFFILS